MPRPSSTISSCSDDLRTRVAGRVELQSGWEIMLDTPGTDLTPEGLALGSSRARLVEFPRRGLPPTATGELLRLARVGLVPVVAHPERYIGCTADMVDGWREFGAVIQVDAMALLGGGTMTTFAREMLSRGLVDMLASDNHGDRRTLSTARAWLQEIGAAAQAELLTGENPGRLLRNEALSPVPPVRFEQGVFDRLRTLVFGRR